MKKQIIIGLLTAVISSSAIAAESGFYVGAGLGQSAYDTGITNVVGASLDEKDTTHGAFIGYDINKFFGVEVAYNDLGKSELKFNAGDSYSIGVLNATATNTGNMSLKAKSIGISAIAKYPVHQYFQPFIKGGFHRYTYEASITSGITSESIKESGTDTTYGFGIESKISANFIARISYDNYSFEEENDVKSTTFSIIYKF